MGRPPAAVTISFAHHTAVENCRFAHLAATGLDYGKGTQHNTIAGNVFTDIGGNAIVAGVFSDAAMEAHLAYHPQDARELCTDLHIANNLITNVTNRILEQVKSWQQRPLESVYFTVWMDGIVLKVKHNGKYVNKCIYLVIGLRQDGLKEVLGMWLAETESASFWMSVLTDLKARGVEDILIACTDNLKGFTDAIKGVFPQTVTQLCIVHQIRNSCKYVVWKDRKSFCADLKEVYAAPNKQAAEDALQALDEKWGHKYRLAIQSWQNNWENLSSYFDYPLEIRKIIYTTNTIENLNRGIRKYTKTKVQFPDDLSAQKAVYLAIINIEKKMEYACEKLGYHTTPIFNDL